MQESNTSLQQTLKNLQEKHQNLEADHKSTLASHEGRLQELTEFYRNELNGAVIDNFTKNSEKFWR